MSSPFIDRLLYTVSEKSAKRICIEGEQSIEEELKKYVETCVCECPAHTNDEFFPIMSELFEITPPLNDDTGNTLASFILPFIFKSAAMNNLILTLQKLVQLER